MFKKNTTLAALFLSASLAAPGFSSVNVNISAPVDSSIAKVFQTQPDALVTEDKADRVLLKAEAAKGDFKAMNRLAASFQAKGREDKAMQWYLTEALMSFGESYNFPEMLRLSDSVNRKEFLAALTNAAQWIRHNVYKNGEDVCARQQLRLKDAFTSLEDGDVELFFAETDSLKYRVARVEFMQFFRHLGIEDVNTDLALKRLHCASTLGNLNAAHDIEDVFWLFENPTDAAVEGLELYLRYRAADVHMRNIRDYLDMKVDGVTQLDNQQQAIGALKVTLKLTEDN